ncbi:MBL fold metallo-hydrolase [Caulobacter sp. 17J65-9]|uniref:MBL fold metallo-hydrolase n=1 Tax=Caulobacter sp. 17J65-9 TaxID=2709382 RepID=UPI0013C98ADD|nr:MBL fold metallo-hydrolase [Caulobacter sp. 17J65-9]NEX94057.1 MBL fold metallo-hydrolase [Caulobacter sp. 17J65-9]
MDTDLAEIADGIYRISTFMPEVGGPAGFTFNQFLIAAEEPLLFHCGHRGLFPAVSAAVAKVTPVERLRWITFGHVEADECGSMNQWLGAAPSAEVAHGATACMVSLSDLADRPPRQLADGEVVDLGGKRVRYMDTPHVPHGWEAGLLFEETTGTLLCGDLFTHVGRGPALTESDVIEPAMAAEALFKATSLGVATVPTLRRLARLKPTTLALMHGSSFAGDGAAALDALADAYEEMIRSAEAEGILRPADAAPPITGLGSAN